MTTFLIVAALLLAIAIAAVAAPLLRKPRTSEGAESAALSLQVLREQLSDLERERQAGTLDAAQYEKECADIERRAIEDGRQPPAAAVAESRQTWLAAAIGAAVAAIAIGLYALLGTPAAFQQPGAGHAAGQQNAHSVTPQQIEAMVARLAERLQDNPGDGEGWLMLARSYNALGRFPEASAAFGRAMSLLPPDAQLLSDYADTLAMAQGRSLRGEPEKIIQRALAADPRNIKALALSGSAAFERQDYAAAIAEWRKVLDIVPPDSNVADRIRNSIADAESRSGGRAGEAGGNTAAKTGVSVQGVVALDSGLRSQVADGDTVFIFARPVAGAKMPLAIKRIQVRDLPARFTLDDSMAMPGGPKLSDHAQVVVGARVSKSGDATPRSGDLEGYADAVPAGATGVRLTISRQIP